MVDKDALDMDMVDMDTVDMDMVDMDIVVIGMVDINACTSGCGVFEEARDSRVGNEIYLVFKAYLFSGFKMFDNSNAKEWEGRRCTMTCVCCISMGW